MVGKGSDSEDDEISIDFSKIKGFFSGRKKSEKARHSKKQAGISERKKASGNRPGNRRRPGIKMMMTSQLTFQKSRISFQKVPKQENPALLILLILMALMM